jgi:ribosomal protein L35
MPKLKTRKVISKRVQAKKSGKVERQAAGKGHFNARNGGKKNRRLRSDEMISNKKDTRNIKRALGTA